MISIKKKLGIGMYWCFVSLAFADAPIVDRHSEVIESANHNRHSEVIQSTNHMVGSSYDLNRRLNKIEHQVDNIRSLLNKLEELQHEVRNLNGQIETQDHKIKLLTTQLKNQPVIDVTPSDVTKTDNVLLDSTSTFSSSNKDDMFLKEQQTYQKAINFLPDKKRESESKLRAYLKQYPAGIYAVNAHYWLGEINFLQKNFDVAEREFKIVVYKYPKSKREADAKLKIALIHQNQGKNRQAVEGLKRVIKGYPGTSAAKFAREQLRNN
ncbi:MAG: tol-pal system protein YbgF [Coxiellaceae bacterium]|jgi:tol-pal system protein YbgF|nr:tol-pal system protein YbgF [Coxiellaceae bacterium]